MPPAPEVPVALTIAGSDCSAGAGLQADLKTFQHFGIHALTAVTCVVSETPQVVEAVHPVPVEVVESQISLLLNSYPVAAIKTGMLHSEVLIGTVARCLAQYPGIPLVVDPVMMASSGSPLIEEDAVDAYRWKLLPLARVITPNLPEAGVLTGRPIDSLEAMEGAALRIADDCGCAVLLKGGHLPGDDCIDVLVDDGQVRHFIHPRIPDADTHGTGCTLAAAIAAGLAQGLALEASVARATDYLAATLRSRYTLGGMQALNQGTLVKSLADEGH